MKKDRICVTGSAITIKIALAVAEAMSMQETTFLADDQIHTRKSRGKGKKRKQWDVR
jgi:hypothetical protein